MKNVKLPILLLSAASAFANGGHAAVISFAGDVEGPEVINWRSTGTPKTFDIDGDDVYGGPGSIGAVQWTITGENQQTLGSSTFGWAFLPPGSGGVTSNGNDIDTDHPLIDDASQSVSANVADVNGSIRLQGFTFELTGTASDYTGKTVRVSVMHDLLNSPGQANDTFKGLQIEQTVGGSGDSGTISLRGGGAGDGVPEFYFFDITGVSPGDRFDVLGLNDVSGSSGNQGYVGPVAFEVIPEPRAYAAIGGLLALGAVLLRRRIRK